MIGGGDDLMRSEYFHAASLQSLECLGAGDFVDKVPVDIEHGRAAFERPDDVAVPNLFK
jgi:hypothetical protein